MSGIGGGYRTVSFSGAPDHGRLLETAVYQHLQREKRGDIFYWKGKQEVDFVLRQGNTIYSILQVVADGLDDDKVYEREINALQEAAATFSKASTKLLVKKLPKRKDKVIYPVWRFLLSCNSGVY